MHLFLSISIAIIQMGDDPFQCETGGGLPVSQLVANIIVCFINLMNYDDIVMLFLKCILARKTMFDFTFFL